MDREVQVGRFGPVWKSQDDHSRNTEGWATVQLRGDGGLDQKKWQSDLEIQWH
jgi:hypothetical protein